MLLLFDRMIVCLYIIRECCTFLLLWKMFLSECVAIIDNKLFRQTLRRIYKYVYIYVSPLYWFKITLHFVFGSRSSCSSPSLWIYSPNKYINSIQCNIVRAHLHTSFDWCFFSKCYVCVWALFFLLIIQEIIGEVYFEKYVSFHSSIVFSFLLLNMHWKVWIKNAWDENKWMLFLSISIFFSSLFPFICSVFVALWFLTLFL